MSDESSAFEPLVVILAGGRSSRFGRDKAAEVVAGTASLDRVRAACEAVVGPAGVVVHDRESGGPLGAVVETFAAHPGRSIVVVACDLPFLDATTLARIVEADDDADGHVARVARVDGRAQPLAARYRPAAGEAFAAAWTAGERSIVKVLDQLDRQQRVAWLDDLDARALADFDTQEDLAALLSRTPASDVTP